MSNSSASNIRDLVIALVFISGLSIFGYYLITNIEVILDNLLVILLIVFGLSLMVGLSHFFVDLGKAILEYLNIIEKSEEQPAKEPETPKEDAGTASQSVDLEIRE